MARGIKVFGKIIKNMDKESIPGQIIVNMKATTVMTRNSDKELIHGLMEGSILVSGRMIKDTVEGSMLSIVNSERKEYGKKIVELDG